MFNIQHNKRAITNFIVSSKFPFVFWAITIFCMHFLISFHIGDDITFFNVLSGSDNYLKTACDFLISRYYTWSSRVIIEFVVLVMVKYKFLWQILDIVVMIWLATSLSLFFNRNKNAIINWFIVFAMFTFPFDSLTNAGWICTTVNYSWPLACALLSMVPIYNMIYKKQTKTYIYAIAIIALIFAVNQELMCGFILLISIILFAYLIIRDKKISKYIISIILICLLSILFIFTCPGNANRLASEIVVQLPEFKNFNIFNKIEIGYSSTLFNLIMKPNLVFSLFCVILFAAVYVHNTKALYRVIALIPLLANMIMGMFGNVFVLVLPNLLSLREQMTRLGTGITFSNFKTWFPDIFITMVIICVAISLFVVFENKKKAMFLCCIIGIGMLTRMILGFSPTIWESGVRTFIFMNFSIIAGCVILFEQLLVKYKEKEWIWKFLNCYAVIHFIFLAEQYLYYFTLLEQNT